METNQDEKRGRGQRGKGRGKYNLSPAAREQRRRASMKSADARRTGTAWRCISVTEPNYFWATHTFGSVNNALEELRELHEKNKNENGKE